MAVLDRRGTIAGAALAAAAIGAILIAFASDSGAASQASLTVNLPPAATDRIYSAPQARGRPIVVIDAGHGGRDPGARSVSGESAEKDLTLALARELRDDLVKRGRVRVAMTRDDDRYLTLDDRAAVARRLNAAMFMSLHMDSAPNPLARGASVYSLSDVASDIEAARFAALENAGADIRDSSGSVEAMLVRPRDARANERFGGSRCAARQKVGGPVRASSQPAPFRRFPRAPPRRRPAVLFEAGYISNADDELLLRSPEHRSQVALALAQAVEADVAAHSRR